MVVSSSSRPLVIVENGRSDAREAQAKSLTRAGFEVATCPGPHGLASPGCPLVSAGDCLLVDSAAAVVYDLDLDDPLDRDVLISMRARHPETPVILELSTAMARRHHHLLEGCTVVPPFSPESLGAAVHAAIGAAVR